MEQQVYVEEWQAHYGSPLHIDSDLPDDASAEIVERSATFAISPERTEPPERLAFVDGVRRGDAYLYLEDPETGALAHGVAGAHARGAALWEDGQIRCDHVETTRLVIWGSGHQCGVCPKRAAATAGRAPRSPTAITTRRCASCSGECAKARGGSPSSSPATAGRWSVTDRSASFAQPICPSAVT